MQNLEQLTSTESQMTLKGVSHTAAIMANAVKLNMKATIENSSVFGFEHYINLSINLHFNEIVDGLNTEDPNYPDDIDTIESMQEQVTTNIKQIGFTLD